MSEAAPAADFVRYAPEVWRACAALAGSARADDLAARTFAHAINDRANEMAVADRLLAIAIGLCNAETGPDSAESGSTAALYRQWLRSVTAELPVDTRNAFLLTALAGFSYADVARASRCSLQRIHLRVDAARRCVLDALGPGDSWPVLRLERR